MKKTASWAARWSRSWPDGYIYDPDGAVTDEKINYLLEMRASGRDKVQDYADKFGCEFHAGEKPWGLGADKVDIMMPCATQNDVNMDSAKKIAASGIKYYIEVANMPTTNDALEFLKEQKHMVNRPLQGPSTPAAWPCPPWRWPRTPSGCTGPPRKWTPRCIRSWRTSITPLWRPPSATAWL